MQGGCFKSSLDVESYFLPNALFPGPNTLESPPVASIGRIVIGFPPLPMKAVI